MFRYLTIFLSISTLASASVPSGKHNLRFEDLAVRWDEAVPLGNGMLGALIWKEDGILRFSLDRADLWDKRPVDNFHKPEFTYDWLYQHVLDGDIQSVQNLIDKPYDQNPAPTKIPAGRLQIDSSAFGKVLSVNLDLGQALCTVDWDRHVRMQSFIHATEPVGWIRIAGATEPVAIQVVPPPFGGVPKRENSQGDSLSGHLLSDLGYPAPQVETGETFLSYQQEGWGNFEFCLYCAWTKTNDGTWEYVWSIQSSDETRNPLRSAREAVTRALKRSFQSDLETHEKWWERFWGQSSISIPDEVIEAQWYREQYKFGSASRRGAPPITLQAIWTADNQQIPPWKGDFHHDLNTELSYWPCYSANHLEEGLTFLDWLEKVKPVFEKWTQQFYQIPGLNVPGVTTIEGEPMGGWNQYSCSPTTSAWLAQHFYLHWRYSMDKQFLRKQAYPWIREVAVFLQGHSRLDEHGKRMLPLSSSPEINDNRIQAWFRQITNYDLALTRWVLQTAAELADELGDSTAAMSWRKSMEEWPELARSEEDGRLLVAPGYPLKESHRHFSHLMAIYPLGLVDGSHGEEDQKTIQASLEELERLGPDAWCGYSYAWLASLYARAHEGEKSAEALRTFAQCFCSINTFHLNGDQSKSGKSKFTYRPFTLEGNFAFAEGVQEMLLQSHTGVVRLFPALPKSWEDARFDTLRAEGAFLISAQRQQGQVQGITIQAEKGGLLRLENPFAGDHYQASGINSTSIEEKDGVLEIKTQTGQTFTLRAE